MDFLLDPRQNVIFCTALIYLISFVRVRGSLYRFLSLALSRVSSLPSCVSELRVSFWSLCVSANSRIDCRQSTMDPPDGSEGRPAEAPAGEPSAAYPADTETTAAPVSLVSKLTVEDAPTPTQIHNPADSTPADLSAVAPVTVFKQVPETPQESADTASQPGKSQKICGVCDAEPGKYKCPRCGMY